MSVSSVEVRKRRSRAEWRSLLSRFSRSELTVARFCRLEGTCPASFYYNLYMNSMTSVRILTLDEAAEFRPQ